MAAIIAGVAGVVSAPHNYQSTAVVVVLPPGSGNPDAMLNPLVNMNDNIAQLAAVLATVLRTDGGPVAAEAGGDGGFTVDTTFGDSPTYAKLTSQLAIHATASTPEGAQHAAQALADYVGTALVKIQADARVPSQNNSITVASVTPQTGTEVSNSPLRSGASYAVATLLIGFVLLIAYDAVRARFAERSPTKTQGARRKRPRHAEVTAAETPEPTELAESSNMYHDESSVIDDSDWSIVKTAPDQPER